MKKYVLLLAIAALYTGFAGAQDSYTAFEGTVFTVGDTVTIGRHGLGNDYRYIKAENDNGFGHKTYTPSREDLYLHRAVIRGLGTDPGYYPGYEYMTAVIDDISTGKKYFMAVDHAITEGNLVMRYVDHSGEEAVALDDAVLFAACLRVNSVPVDDGRIMRYIEITDPELHKKCRADEFEFHKVKDAVGQELTSRIDGFDFDAVYRFEQPFYIGRYDFDRGGYPAGLFDSQSETESHLIKHRNYYLLVTNREGYRMVPVPMEEAQLSNKRRQGPREGNAVNNQVHGRFYVRLNPERLEIPKSQYSIINVENVYRHSLVGAELVRLEVYEHPGTSFNLIGVVE